MTRTAPDLVVSAAASLRGEADTLSATLVARLKDEIPELAGDQALTELMVAGVGENVRTALDMVLSGTARSDIVPPLVALETARRLAQRGIPISALLRAYRVGHAMFQRALLSRLADAGLTSDELAAATMVATEVSFDYIDRVSQDVVDTYERERDDWIRGRTAARAGRVAAVVAGRSVDAAETERLLGYRFEQSHVGVVVWVPDAERADDRIPALERVVHRLAERVGTRRPPLVIAVDEATVWAWLPAPVLTLESVETTFGAEVSHPIRVAAGEPASGLSGFALTHRQARQAQTVASAAQLPGGGRLTLSAAIGPVALMCADLDATGAWVRATLGGLAVDDEPHARLRETLWAFLAAGGSYTAAAQQLILHKNTVQYRVRKAEEARGRSVHDRRLDLELALLVARALGGAVLVPVARGRR